MARIRIYVQYYCKRHGCRVVPYSKFEKRTLAPDRHVLLSSFNSRVDPEDRIAYCFVCRGFSPAVRLTEPEILQLYIRRRGVAMAHPTRSRKRTAA